MAASRCDCGNEMEWEECESCGDSGFSHHDCGEDCCCCADPEDNVRCSDCEGVGSFEVCHACIDRARACGVHP